MTDFASGLTADDDYALPAPENVPGFNETFCFYGFDDKADMGFFVHIQARPQPWRFNLVVFLPGGQDFLKRVVFSEDRVPWRPGGERFHAECLEPFRRWRVRAALECSPQTTADMLAMRDVGPPRTAVDLDIVCAATAPLWCIGANDGSTPEEHGQRGFRVHHQQLTDGLGTIRIAGKEIRFDGPVWRDHSRGPRTLTEWGAHDLNSAWFPKQRRGLGLLRQFDITGKPTCSYAYVVEDGVLEDAEVIESTPLGDIASAPNPAVVVLRAKSGKTHRMDGLLRAQMITGIGPGSWLSEGQATWTLNGEQAVGICERSCRGGPPIADAAVHP